MSRTVGSDGEKTQAAIRRAAIGLFATYGYEAVAMRQLAAEVGVQAAALYRYFPTKEDLLFDLMRGHMLALIASWQAARPAGDDPVEALGAFVRNHIRFHLADRQSTHVSNLELRSLSPARLAEVLALRGRYEADLRTILAEGAASGDFAIDDPKLAAMAIIQMITGVIVWFRPPERDRANLSVGEVAESYYRMTMRMVGAPLAGASLEENHVRPHDALRAW
jgi:AcrR family transcriptional regulator